MSRLLLLLGVLVLLAGCSSGPRGGVAVGQPAPDFTATTLDGRTVRLAELRGKVVVLDFWATWCPPCRAMIPHERELVQKYAGKPLVFLGISADDDANGLHGFLRANGMTWPMVHDGPDGPLQQQYQVTYFPTLYVLDGQGVVRYRDVRDQALERAVARLVAGLAK
jgi:thiol-disulfide isomerase/thioredoxin